MTTSFSIAIDSNHIITYPNHLLLHASVLLFNYNYYTECICVLNKSSCVHVHGVLSSLHRSLKSTVHNIYAVLVELIIVLAYYSALVKAKCKCLGTVQSS